MMGMFRSMAERMAARRREMQKMEIEDAQRYLLSNAPPSFAAAVSMMAINEAIGYIQSQADLHNPKDVEKSNAIAALKRIEEIQRDIFKLLMEAESAYGAFMAIDIMWLYEKFDT